LTHGGGTSLRRSERQAVSKKNLMPDSGFGTILTILRIIRGMNQEELAQASGLRSSTISEYERGKMVPGLNTVQRLLGAMGYSFRALDQARALISSLQPENLSAGELLAWGLPEGPAALRREIQQISAEAGRVVSRLIRLLFVLMLSPVFREPGPPAE
jgi:transcriptional regulator with XRE-family HTH domain